MLAFPSMLLEAARKAGMPVPRLGKNDKFDSNKFPHFAVFCNVQLCRRIRWGEHWDNAKVIAKIPANKIKKVTLAQLIASGLEYST